MTFKRNDHADVSRTSLVALVYLGFKELEKAFGYPQELDGYKVSSEWTFESEEGEVFTLYDYKLTSLYSQGLPSVEEFRAMECVEFSIGGKTSPAGFLKWLEEQVGHPIKSEITDVARWAKTEGKESEAPAAPDTDVVESFIQSSQIPIAVHKHIQRLEAAARQHVRITADHKALYEAAKRWQKYDLGGRIHTALLKMTNGFPPLPLMGKKMAAKVQRDPEHYYGKFGAIWAAIYDPQYREAANALSDAIAQSESKEKEEPC